MAIDVAHIREVSVLPALSLLPGGPKAALGVTLLRGELTPVVDLARLVDPKVGSTDLTRIVSLTSLSAALAVDRIDMLEASSEDSPCILTVDGVTRPYPLAAEISRCFEDAWRQARAGRA